MIRTSNNFFIFFMISLNFLLALSQLTVYLTNYPNEFIHPKSHQLFYLSNSKEFTPELSLGFGGSFLLITVIFLVIKSEGTKDIVSKKYQIAFLHILMGGLMAYINYFPIATFSLLLLTILFCLFVKPDEQK